MLPLSKASSTIRNGLKAGGIGTPGREAEFLAQACLETDYFKALKEYGGPAYFERYEGRRDLGKRLACGRTWCCSCLAPGSLWRPASSTTGSDRLPAPPPRIKRSNTSLPRSEQSRLACALGYADG